MSHKTMTIWHQLLIDELKLQSWAKGDNPIGKDIWAYWEKNRPQEIIFRNYMLTNIIHKINNEPTQPYEDF